MSRGVCHFYGKPGGCRRRGGGSCPFLHIDSANGHSAAGTVRGRGSPSRASGSGPATQPGGLPPGVCRQFWETGDCRWGFQCRASHIVNPARASDAPTVPSTAVASIPAALAPFLTDAGLARMNEMSADVLFTGSHKPKSPTEVHNFLKRFLYDGYQFRASLDVYAFLGLLADASSTNATWTTEDGQLLLSAIAKDNGLIRISDILNWKEVSAKAGNSREILSFQRGYVPLLQYFSSDFVVKSILSHLTNALYMLLMDHFESFAQNVQMSMEDIVRISSFKDPNIPVQNTGRDVGGVQVFGSLAVVLLQVLTRIKNVTIKEPKLRPLVLDIRRWADIWIEGISATPPIFADILAKQSLQIRDQVINHLNTKIDQLVSIVDREHNKLERSKRQLCPAKVNSSVEGILAALHNSYDGPGSIRADGPRHNNDYIDINDIRIAPTHEELICRIPPFLPANLHGSPHPHGQESVERLQDIQFRLLREELTASLRTSVQLVRDDLSSTRRQTQLSEVVKKKGGKYRGQSDGQDAVLFNIYTGIEFAGIAPDWRGLSVSLSIDTPPGRARSSQARSRAAFWEGMSGKRLLSGGLVALLWQQGAVTDVHLGIISSSLRDHVDSSKHDPNRMSIRVSFFDPSIELRILHELHHHQSSGQRGLKFLVEATVMFESIRPFLEALRVEPTTVPLSQYLVHRAKGVLNTMTVDPPKYARQPGYNFELASLFPPDAGVETLKLSVLDPASVANARERLRHGSRLDPSQADAVVDTLTRELALIQGPPGTGKSYTGVQLIDVLLANHAGPILMIAFTNHALDHMLTSVLEADITQKIVRLGSRSADERISQFSLENMEKVAGQSRLDRAFAGNHRNLKEVEGEIKQLMKEYLKQTIEPTAILSHLEILYPEFHQSFLVPPPWVRVLHSTQNSDTNSEWQRVGKGGKTETTDNSLYSFWLACGDLDFLEAAHNAQTANQEPATSTPPSSHNAYSALAIPDNDIEILSPVVEAAGLAEDDLDDQLEPEEAWQILPTETKTKVDHNPSRIPSTVQEPIPANVPKTHEEAFIGGLRPSDIRDLDDFFGYFGLTEIPSPAKSDQPLESILQQEEVWSLSRSERQCLHRHWDQEVRFYRQENHIAEFERLRTRHKEYLDRYNEGKAAARSELLRNVDIIGCTTTGAAKLTSLLKAVSPRIMLVEEAGQVLEAHILGSLVPSVQHLILIGDPLQLRPTIENYALSVDHSRGGLLYKFDMSLMERLSSSGLPMSQIDVQRRMRPQISNLVRTTLYPKLEDHDLVKHYPNVQGMAKNTFFFTHNHKENAGEDDSISKFNQFEVDIVVDLVMHLLRQGPYSAEGDIVVLCAYLGQLARMRDALANKVAVVIDERDQVELADRESEKEEVSLLQTATVDHIKVSRRVRLRTIDNYQGEEAKIVILTLVRNSGGSNDDDAAFGHSSKGRVNVGFLKSENRTNVALSRAREGLFILGNAADLASRSKMWRSVIGELEKDDCVGEAFPVVCAQHKDRVEYISKPGQLPRVAPDGGCLRQCDARLKCGHMCPYKCHSDDPKHVAVRCEQRCTRLCARGHPCTKACAEDCGKCSTQVASVKLPCGHIKDHVYCWQQDDLASVVCDVIVKKQLPHCEHDADIRCSDDPARVRCRKVCNGTMSCCGRNCKAQCHVCQQLNGAENILEDDQLDGRIQRKLHHEHPCERRLYCDHLCGKACSENHACTTECKDSCRQVCAHASCKDYCSTPCAPCQEPCTWQCSHHACPVPCGSICARLPCDVRCKEILSCGHRCPSVCGEECSIQICPACAPSHIANTVVDMILQRTLADIDPDLEALDELLITIPNCGHVFTVETLDGLCDMTAYYKRADDDSKWVGLETPPPSFTKPPSCPTCRSAITAPRYGRIFKRADLDILENNIASSMSQSLSKVAFKTGKVSLPSLHDQLKGFAADPKLSGILVRSSPPPQRIKEQRKEQAAMLKETRLTPLPPQFIDPAANLHGIPTPEVTPWRRVVNILLAAYRDSLRIASTRSAHTHAWEASFTYLYQKEMESAVQDPLHAPRNPQEHGMRMARLGVGQPQPRADMRFRVEAFWMTINVRLTLVDTVKTWSDSLSSRPDYPEENRRLWNAYRVFILKSCAQDSNIALETTQRSESHRQTVKTSLLMLRIELELFRFNLDMTRQGKTLSREARQTLADRANVKRKETEVRILEVLQQHRSVRRSNALHEEEWLTSNFAIPSQAILDEWQELERSLRLDTFYQPVSLQEMSDIVKSFSSEFTHTGHFYKCPNGHTFVITECGGAMETSHCPECGEKIGGSSHNLLASNARDDEYERLVREQGARQSPWRWGR